MSTLATALEIPDSSDDEAARPQLQPLRPTAGDTATGKTGKADAPLEISDSDDDAPASKRQRTDDAPVDLTLDSGDDEAARPGSPDTDGSPNARAFWPGIPEKGDDKAPAPQRKPGPAPLSQFFAPRAPSARGTKPPGLLRLGVRRGGGPDPKGTRSLSEEKFVELLRREEIAVVCDMRSGRGADTCGRKLKNPSRWEPCGISPPKFMCQCSIAAACTRGGAEYRWVGKPRNTSHKDRGKNLGGSRIALLPKDKGESEGKPAEKVSGDMRRAYLDPTNTGGRWCLNEAKEPQRYFVTFDPESYANLRDIGALSKRKRVALLCVEDELAICHCKVLLDIMLRDRMVDAAVAIEPESLVPGAGWANVRCDCSRDWKAELDARKTARRK